MSPVPKGWVGLRGSDNPSWKGIPDESLIKTYTQTRSIDKTAKVVGLNRASVHERLVKLGVVCAGNGPRFSAEEQERLKREYSLFRDLGRVSVLAKQMGRSPSFLNRQARQLGLTLPLKGRPKPWIVKWKYLSDDAARAVFNRFLRHRKGSVRQVCQRMGIKSWQAFGVEMKRRFPDEWEASIESREIKSTLYRYGRAFEYRVRDALKRVGYFVLRSPQSKSPIDLVAVCRGVVLFVQCKRSGQMGVCEWNALFELARSVGAIPLLAEASVKRGEILYWRLLAEKDGSKRTQPRGGFIPEHA